MEYKYGVAYAGLCDVIGGKMWFCITPKKEIKYFLYKRDCLQYIGVAYKEEKDRDTLSGQVYASKGRSKLTSDIKEIEHYF